MELTNIETFICYLVCGISLFFVVIGIIVNIKSIINGDYRGRHLIK